MENFARNLRTLRQSRGITQKEIALKIGIQQSAYARYESGQVSPSADMLYRICEALSVSADNILGITSDAGESDFVEWKKRALLAEAKLETIKAVMRKLIDE